MRAAKAVVVISSTVGLEALLYTRPVYLLSVATLQPRKNLEGCWRPSPAYATSAP